MSSMRKLNDQTEVAYARYRAAAAAYVAHRLSGLGGPELARLGRRTEAYRVQWEAAARRVEYAIESRGA